MLPHGLEVQSCCSNIRDHIHKIMLKHTISLYCQVIGKINSIQADIEVNNDIIIQADNLVDNSN